MIVGTGRHLRLAAGVAALLFLATGCAATGAPPAPTSTPRAAETPSAAPTPSASAAPEAPQPPEIALAMDESAPVRLSIPKLGVESDLLYTGLRDDGTLDVPPGDEGSPASWYDGSPTPGSSGPAILLGHVNSLSDASGIFYGLRDLVAGDRISVTREDGRTATFEVYRN
ncbi:MAG TPA: sortase, partial [Naasia sp.]